MKESKFMRELRIDSYNSPSFKIGQLVTFKFNGKQMNGKVVTIGEYKGVNVSSNGKYYYCHGYRKGIFFKSNIINYSDIKTR